jgi:hypothetical protein
MISEGSADPMPTRVRWPHARAASGFNLRHNTSEVRPARV